MYNRNYNDFVFFFIFCLLFFSEINQKLFVRNMICFLEFVFVGETIVENV